MKINDFINGCALRISGMMMNWAHVRMAKQRGWDPQVALNVTKQEANAIWGSVRKVITYRAGEVELLEDRLSRRYDIGMAMNEATNRAIAQKQEARQSESGLGLTDRQKLALKFQQEHLNRIVKNS